jgi:hypothetical protein
MQVEISNGELLDKLSILLIKVRNITDTDKLHNVQTEIDILSPLCETLLVNSDIKVLFDELLIVNTELWDVEDFLREKERVKEFDTDFIEFARRVYYTNDKRARIKKQINLLSNSSIIEEKSYTPY